MLLHARSNLLAPVHLVGAALRLPGRGRDAALINDVAIKRDSRVPPVVRTRLGLTAHGASHETESPETGKPPVEPAGLCFWKTGHGTLPWLISKGMRSQLKLVITTCVVCHLLLGASPVTSQALPGAGLESAQEAPNQGATPCHAVLTAPPSITAGAKPENHAGTQPKLAISQEQPVD